MALITTSVELCNMALARVGHKKITALTDDNKAARMCNLHYSNELDNMILEVVPNWAIRRDRLTAAGDLNTVAITVTITGNTAPTADTIVRDAGSFLTDGFVSGDRVTITGSASNNKTYDVDTVAALTLTLDTHAAATTETLALDSDLKLFAAPASEYAYKYALPSDYLKVISVNKTTVYSEPAWEVENKYIVTNEKDTNDQINVKLLYKVTDVSLFSSAFVRALYLKIASQLAMPLANSRPVQEDILLELEDALRKVKYIKSTEGKPEEQPADSAFGWVAER